MEKRSLQRSYRWSPQQHITSGRARTHAHTCTQAPLEMTITRRSVSDRNRVPQVPPYKESEKVGRTVHAKRLRW